MATWQALSSESWAASQDLFVAGRRRSVVSRAYYAVFARAAGVLAAIPVTMPQDREGPAHGKLPELVLDNLGSLPLKNRMELAALIATLYNLRIYADYWPSIELEAGEAR